MEALRLEHISHAYGNVLAVDDFNLSIAPGELVCLVGPSGCGKTTVLRLVAGLEPLQSGSVLANGRPFASDAIDLPPEDRDVGLVFQDYALFPHLNVLKNVAFGLRKNGSADRRRLALQGLQTVGMADYAKAYPHTLSGGQQQRVALARALATKPAIMLLDEPFSGLDTMLRQQVRDQTLHILKQSAAASLLVTHDPEEAMFMADRIALMRDGRLVQVGTPTDLYFRPVNAFAACFFGEANRLSSRVRSGYASTPFGAVAAEGLEDGLPVEVLIRPEALHLQTGGPAQSSAAGKAQVIASRLLGRSSLVHLSVSQGEKEALHIHARVPGRFLPAEDEAFEINLDSSQAFVFPLSDAK